VDSPTRICAIDIGTNSFHALIVDAWPNGTFKEIDRLKEMVRLGRRGLAQHRLTEEAMQRGVEALKRIKLLAEGRGVNEYIIYATSAVREATNGGEFIERVLKEVGLRILPISGEQEALLIWKGVRRVVDLQEPSLLMDIGGGSTEFIVADDQTPYFLTSLRLGAARMSEQWSLSDPATSEEIEALREYYQQQLQPIVEATRSFKLHMLVGSSGTMENLAQATLYALGGNGVDLFRCAIPVQAFRKTLKKIITSNRKEREHMKGIEKKRIDQIVSGAVLVDEVLRLFPSIEEIRVSSAALREGMISH